MDAHALLSVIRSPFFLGPLSAFAGKHLTDGAQVVIVKIQAQIVKHPAFQFVLPTMAALLGFGINLAMAALTGADMTTAMQVSGPMAGLGGIWYHDTLTANTPPKP